MTQSDRRNMSQPVSTIVVQQWKFYMVALKNNIPAPERFVSVLFIHSRVVEANATLFRGAVGELTQTADAAGDGVF